MSKELDRLINSLTEVVLEDAELSQAIEVQGYDSAGESERLKKILRHGIEDFRRFYIRRSLSEERTLSAKQVADRYGLTEQWVYHCLELQAVAFKVGKYLRYRESDLAVLEKARLQKQKDVRMSGYLLSARRLVSETTAAAEGRSGPHPAAATKQ